MRRTRALTLPFAAALAASVLAACGSDDADPGDEAVRPTVAVTTTVLGDVVAQLVGDLAEVVTIMPPGASPHDFQASAREAADLAAADVIVVNGGGFEEGLLSVVEGAESDGVPVLSALELLGGDDHAEEDDHADDDEHADDDGHAHDDDAHFFTDPLAVAEVVEALAAALPAQVPGLDAEELAQQADDLVGDLEDLHQELVETLAVVPDDRRVLVTDHEVFDSFAARYDFEVLATVIPAGSTSDGVSGGALAELAQVLQRAGVTAVFTEQTASADLAETLADEVGDVEVVTLNAETLGPDGSEADTYAGMMRSNAQRIADALGG
ncbi:MAG TPA: zinc ABC transporter substrate-binding protein [Acidimicrobiaceae bacterium]|nr:zinc ABC transporter substrate-binding protein [Acidimicrobiaceae bacterium]